MVTMLLCVLRKVFMSLPLILPILKILQCPIMFWTLGSYIIVNIAKLIPMVIFYT